MVPSPFSFTPTINCIGTGSSQHIFDKNKSHVTEPNQNCWFQVLFLSYSLQRYSKPTVAHVCFMGTCRAPGTTLRAGVRSLDKVEGNCGHRSHIQEALVRKSTTRNVLRPLWKQRCKLVPSRNTDPGQTGIQCHFHQLPRPRETDSRLPQYQFSSSVT